jgi:hypothetical protein
MKVAFLVIRNRFAAKNVNEFIDGIKKYSICEMHEINPNTDGYFEFDINEYDGICLHYSTIAFPMRVLRPFSNSFRRRLKEFNGIKLAFVQDEQRALLDRIDFFNEIGLDHLFSPSPNRNLTILYPTRDCSFRVSSIMTSYVMPTRNSGDINIRNRRKWDVFYRGRRSPNWLGENAKRKSEVGSVFIEHINFANLKVNISSAESLRIYGNFWYHFLYLSKSSLLTPSGTTIIDMDGRYLEKWVKPDMPQIHVREPLELNNSMTSPKLFEYAQWGTLIISDHLIEIDEFMPGHDYFLLDEKMSNVQFLMDILNDDLLRFDMTERARLKLIENKCFSYESLAQHFDKVCSDLEQDTEFFFRLPVNLSRVSVDPINFKLVFLIKIIPTKIMNGILWLINNGIRTVKFCVLFIWHLK